MRSILRSFTLAVLTIGIGSSAVHAQEIKQGDVKPATVQPDPRDKGWMGRHEKFVEISKRGGVEVLFLGDSITDAWGGEGHNPKAAGATIYEADFLPLKTANFGIGGDRTQHVLWRLQNGEFDDIKPKVLMLMIGTNNVGSDSADDIAAGIETIVNEIHSRSPKTKVLLLAVFPRGEKPNPGREKLAAVNKRIAKLDDGGKTTQFLDIGPKFVQDDGSISKEIMPDFLHLSPEGYRIWADAVKGPIHELMQVN